MLHVWVGEVTISHNGLKMLRLCLNYISHQIANVDLLETSFRFLWFLDPAVLLALSRVVWLQLKKYTPVVKILELFVQVIWGVLTALITLIMLSDHRQVSNIAPRNRWKSRKISGVASSWVILIDQFGYAK